MKKIICFVASLVLLMSVAAFAQVTKAEIQGVEFTLPPSEVGSSGTHDGSVGEAEIVVIAMDANGDPVADAAVSWTLRNRKTGMVFVVNNSGIDGLTGIYGQASLMFDGGVTDAEGKASITLDASAAGDIDVRVSIDEVDASGYGGRNMRIVWFD